MARIGVWALVVGLLAGCNAVEDDVRTFVGEVTEVEKDVVCIGTSEASGECFRPNEQTDGLRVGDCVEASYRTDVDEGPYTVIDLRLADADAHAEGCPLRSTS